MTALILSVFISLLRLVSTQPVSHADLLTPPSITALTPHQAQLQPVAYAPTSTMVVGIVPASAFPSCRNPFGSVLYITRPQRVSTVVYHNNVPADGPVCTVSSAVPSSLASVGEPLFVVPLTEKGTLSEQPCMTISAPQQFCEIPLGSPLSAFPLV